jgi:hypothetical protein
MRKDLHFNNYSLDAGLSDRIRREAYLERVDRGGGVRETELNLRSTSMLHDPGVSCESLGKGEGFHSNTNNRNQK